MATDNARTEVARNARTVWDTIAADLRQNAVQQARTALGHLDLSPSTEVAWAIAVGVTGGAEAAKTGYEGTLATAFVALAEGWES